MSKFSKIFFISLLNQMVNRPIHPVSVEQLLRYNLSLAGYIFNYKPAQRKFDSFLSTEYRQSLKTDTFLAVLCDLGQDVSTSGHRDEEGAQFS